MKKYLITLALFIMLACCLTAVGAVSHDDAALEQNASDETLSAADNVPVAGDNESIVVNAKETNDEIRQESAPNNATTQDSTSPKGNAALKIGVSTNTVKRGTDYKMYLKDSKGQPVANKKIIIDCEGKTYAKTTDRNGMFSLKISSGKSTVTLKVSFAGDDKYGEFSRTLTVNIVKTMPITIGNSKLLTNGYLRVYLHGDKKSIAKKTVKIKIGTKTYTKTTNAEGFIVMKPNLPAGWYTVVVEYGNYSVAKNIKCIKGNVKDPLKTYVPMVNGIPDIDVMPARYVMGDENAKYTLKKWQYKEVLKRDSYCLYLYGKLSKYTFFKTKDSPDTYHILKRGSWNVIERALNVKLVKKNRYKYWPKSITVSLDGKSYTYSVVRDVQNTKFTCGPTSASVCSQALKKYRSEKFFQIKAHVTSGVNVNVLKSAIDHNGFRSHYYHSVDVGVKQLKKGGCALIAFLPNHYVSVIDVSKNGKKILVSNSYGKYDVGGDSRVPTKWVSVKYFKSKFAGVGLVVKLKYSLSKKDKKTVKNYYKSMGPKFQMKNTRERIPNT